MKDRMAESFRESPVEITVGLVALVAGLALTSQDGWPRVVGAVLTATASYLISWTMAATKARYEAKLDLRERMTQVGTYLATTSSRIVEAIRGGETRETQPETAFALVRDGAANLFGLVQQIEEQTGRAISSKAVIQNAARLMDLSIRLRQILASVDTVDAEELHEVQSELEAVAEELSESPVPRPQVEKACPQCGKPVKFTLGDRKGDSAMPRCDNCKTRFHAHRQEDAGGIMARLPGALQLVTLRDIEATCPECNSRVSLRVARNEDDIKTRFCMNCHTRLEIEPDEGTVIRHQKARAEAADVVRVKNNQAVLLCPGCGWECKAFYRRDDDVFSVCHRCEPPRLLVADVATSPGAELSIEEVSAEVDKLKELSREAAVNYVRGLLLKRPDSGDLYQILGASLRKWGVELRDGGEETKGVRCLREAVVAHDKALELLGEDGSESASIQYARGRALLEMGEKEQARGAFEAALRGDPEYEKAATYLQELEEAVPLEK